MKTNDFKDRVYEIVNDIPEGYVLTYGIVAALANAPRNSRLVARYMTASEKINNHRIVNSVGRIAPGWDEQRTLLEAEGVSFKENGNVDLKKHLWRPSR
jgi:methylated-DNA-protein-cysteine methyltransferase-like protein